MEEENIKELLENKKKFQLELNALLSAYMSGEELKEIKQLISNYYAEKLTKEFDKLANERGWTQETYKSWLTENLRTPYKKQ